MPADNSFVEAYIDAIDEQIQDESKHVDFKWLSNRLSCPAETAKRYFCMNII